MKTTTLCALGAFLTLGCSKPMPPAAGGGVDEVTALADGGDVQATVANDAEDLEAVKGPDLVEAVSDTSPDSDGDDDAALPDAAVDTGNQDLAQDASPTQPCLLEPLPAPAPVPGTACSKIGQRRCSETGWTYKPALTAASPYPMLCHRPNIAECVGVGPSGSGIWQESDCQAELQAKGGIAWKTCNTGWAFCRESEAAGAHCVPWGLNDVGIAPVQKFVPMPLCPTHALGQTGCWGGSMTECQQLTNGKFTGGKPIQWPISAPTYECLPYGEGGTFWVPVQYCGGGVPGNCPGQELYGKCKLQSDGLYRCDKDVWEAGCKAGGK